MWLLLACSSPPPPPAAPQLASPPQASPSVRWVQSLEGSFILNSPPTTLKFCRARLKDATAQGALVLNFEGPDAPEPRVLTLVDTPQGVETTVWAPLAPERLAGWCGRPLRPPLATQELGATCQLTAERPSCALGGGVAVQQQADGLVLIAAEPGRLKRQEAPE